jgi:ribosomal-protein-alanine N-acetyltransferase
MDDRYQIRQVDLADLPAILAIERASFSDPWSRQDFADCLNTGVPFLGAERQGHLVGYIIAHYGADEGEILNLGVQESDRRHGTGRALVTAMLDALRQRGVASVYLEVRASNTVAQHLYDRLGFVHVGRRPHYYRLPTEDAVVLRVGI